MLKLVKLIHLAADHFHVANVSSRDSVASSGSTHDVILLLFQPGSYIMSEAVPPLQGEELVKNVVQVYRKGALLLAFALDVRKEYASRIALSGLLRGVGFDLKFKFLSMSIAERQCLAG